MRRTRINLQKNKSYNTSESILNRLRLLFSKTNHNNIIKLSRNNPENIEEDSSISNNSKRRSPSILIKNQTNLALSSSTNDILPIKQLSNEIWKPEDHLNILSVDSKQQINEEQNNLSHNNSEQNLFQYQPSYITFKRMEQLRINQDLSHSSSFVSFHEKSKIDYSLYSKSLSPSINQHRDSIISNTSNNYRTS
ncbi:unnamed protein product, partial [Didymodactylos carnosus]